MNFVERAGLLADYQCGSVQQLAARKFFNGKLQRAQDKPLSGLRDNKSISSHYPMPSQEISTA